MPFPLFELPFELLIDILKDVEIVDLIRCQSVCRHLRDTIQESLILQYRIELWVSGLIEYAPRQWSMTDRLARLRSHVGGWKYLQPSLREEIPLSINSGTLYELYGNVFARGTVTPWLGRSRPTNGICFVELPSATSDLPTKKWVREDLGMNLADFTMDPGQDLLVLIEKRPHVPFDLQYSIHLRSVATNEPHPLARVSELTYSVEPIHEDHHFHTHTFTHYLMQVCGDMLGVLFLRRDNAPVHGRIYVSQELIIWNWKTGVQRAELTPETLSNEHAHSFSFLAPDVVLLGKTTDDEGLLDICMLYDDSDERGMRAERIATFQLPKAKGNWTYFSVLSRSDPAPIVRASYPGASSTPKQKSSRDPLFVFDPSSRLFVFTISLGDFEQGIERRVVLFTHLSTLLEPVRDFLAHRASGSIAPTYRRFIPWSKWAEKTRILPDRQVASHVCYIAGYRYITTDGMAVSDVPNNGTGPHGGSCIRVLDFNPVQMRRELSREQHESVERAPLGVVRHLVTTPTREPELFVSRAMTCLPYAEITAGVAIPDATGFLLDTERIIVMRKVRGREMLDILSF